MTLNASDRDDTVDPGVDFYRFANGGWLDANPIPADFGAWGAFEEVHTRNEALLHDLLLHAAERPANDLDRKLGDYFTSGMDTDAIERAGISAIQPTLDAIGAVATHQDVFDLLPQLHDSGFGELFMWGVTVDHDDSTSNLLWLVPTGLGLPDRDAYFDGSEAATALRAGYVDHVAAQLENVGTPSGEASALAPDVLAFEARLAEQHFRAEERRDLGRTLNRHDLEALRALAPELDLPAYLVAVGAGEVTTVNVQNPAYLAALHGIVLDTELPTLRAHLAFHVVRSMADALPAAIDGEAFAFYGRRVEGMQEQKDRYKRVVAALGEDMGEALGQRFVDETFPPEAKDRAVRMVEEIVAEMRHSLESVAWMSDDTRAQALAKLATLRVKIGYPDTWRDWSELTIGRESFAANRLNAARFELDRQLAKLAVPVDPNDWEMPPHAVNAYFHPTRNEIVFPAGILQPPMFDAEADAALNYGGIGTVIAHEITHARRPGQAVRRQRRFRRLVERGRPAALHGVGRPTRQFDEYVVVDDVHVNSRLTLGENIADLGGVALAGRAHARRADAAPWAVACAAVLPTRTPRCGAQTRARNSSAPSPRSTRTAPGRSASWVPSPTRTPSRRRSAWPTMRP
jgi:predicted metalloendopeptidase